MVITKTQFVSDSVFIVKHLVSKAQKTVDASRLQFYSDKDLSITIRFQGHIHLHERKFTVESFKDFR